MSGVEARWIFVSFSIWFSAGWLDHEPGHSSSRFNSVTGWKWPSSLPVKLERRPQALHLDQDPDRSCGDPPC